MVPCSPCSFPPGTSIDTHYIKTVNEDGSPILVAANATDGAECCPVASRTKDCWNCGFLSGTSSETHYISTGTAVDITATGLDACCPVLPLPPDDTVPCVNCGLPPTYDPAHYYVDTTHKTSAGSPAACCPPKLSNPTPFGCIPQCPEGYTCSNNECILGPTPSSGCSPACVEPSYCIEENGSYSCYTPCDPPCSGCQNCVDGDCVQKPLYPCVSCSYDGGSLFPSGTSIDTHYIDTSATFCDPDTCCPPMVRTGDPDENYTTIHVNAGEVVSSMPPPNVVKTGPGTLVININPNSPDNFCKTINIQEGVVIIRDPRVVNGDTRIILGGGNPNLINGKLFTCGFDISNAGGPGTVITVGGIDFGPDLRYNVSYTSDSTDYVGQIILGFNSINIPTNSLGQTDLRNLLIAGRNGGSWDGDYGFVTNKEINGIKNLGYVYNDDSTTTIGWAAPGDTNLDGTIDILDVANILSSGKFDTGQSAHWFEGDFNYDGVVDVLDMASFLSSDLFDKGVYLPQDTSFNINWSPQSTSTRPLPPTLSDINISLNTVNKSEPVTYRTFEPPFNIGGKQMVRDCEITTKWECNAKTTSVFLANMNCYDGVEKRLPIPNNQWGACCTFDGPEPCAVIRGTPNLSAPFYCEQVLKGFYKGNGTVCSDQICGQTKIITIPTTPVNPTPIIWGGCCYERPSGNFCQILTDRTIVDADVEKGVTKRTETAFYQCSQDGGTFFGYGKYCDDFCRERAYGGTVDFFFLNPT